MTQQVPPPPSKLRKGFLVVGIVLLIMGFFFFYLASSVGYDYVTTYNNEVNLAYPSSEYPQSGAYEYYARNVIMQPNDALTVSYPENIQINGTLQIVLVEQVMDINNTVLAVSGYPFSSGVVYYKNEPQFNGIVVRARALLLWYWCSSFVTSCNSDFRIEKVSLSHAVEKVLVKLKEIMESEGK